MGCSGDSGCCWEGSIYVSAQLNGRKGGNMARFGVYYSRCVSVDDMRPRVKLDFRLQVRYNHLTFIPSKICEPSSLPIRHRDEFEIEVFTTAAASSEQQETRAGVSGRNLGNWFMRVDQQSHISRMKNDVMRNVRVKG